MSKPNYDELLELLVTFKSTPSRYYMLLPENERGELVGLDAEVWNFKAERALITVRRTTFIKAGEVYLLKDPEFTFSPGFRESGRYYNRLRGELF